MTPPSHKLVSFRPQLKSFSGLIAAASATPERFQQKWGPLPKLPLSTSNWRWAGEEVAARTGGRNTPETRQAAPLGPLFWLEIRKKTFPQTGNNKQIIHAHQSLIETVPQ